MVEWSEQLRSVISAWLGAVRGSVQVRLYTSGCMSEKNVWCYIFIYLFIYIYIYILKTADRTVSACCASSVQCRDLGKADTNANIYALPGAPRLWASKHHAMPECSNHRGSELNIYIYIYIYIKLHTAPFRGLSPHQCSTD